MFELTIQDTVYQFVFGIGFLRAVNKRVSVPVSGMPGVKKDIGFRYTVAGVIDGDVEALIELLDAGNFGQNPRITKALLESYIDDQSTDIDQLFGDVIDFLSRNNATKKTMESINQAIAENEE